MSNISIKGLQSSNVVLGNNNAIHQKVTNHAQPSTETLSAADVKAEIMRVSGLLETLVGERDAPRVKNAMEEAAREVDSHEPRKDVVADSLDRALKVVSATGALGNAVTQLRPSIERLAGWLGDGVTSLLRWLG